MSPWSLILPCVVIFRQRRSAAFRPTQDAESFSQRSSARPTVRVTGGAQCSVVAAARPNHGRRRSPSHVAERSGGLVARSTVQALPAAVEQGKTRQQASE